MQMLAVLAIRDEKPELINPANDFDFVFGQARYRARLKADKVITPTTRRGGVIRFVCNLISHNQTSRLEKEKGKLIFGYSDY